MSERIYHASPRCPFRVKPESCVCHLIATEQTKIIKIVCTLPLVRRLPTLHSCSLRSLGPALASCIPSPSLTSCTCFLMSNQDDAPCSASSPPNTFRAPQAAFWWEQCCPWAQHASQWRPQIFSHIQQSDPLQSCFHTSWIIPCKEKILAQLNNWLEFITWTLVPETYPRRGSSLDWLGTSLCRWQHPEDPYLLLPYFTSENQE